MEHVKRIFDTDEKVCKRCKRKLHELYKEELCPECLEFEIFIEVKDYIRANDVKENDVAEHFGIPVSKVRRWIKEGRIQYKCENSKTVSGVHCQICGKSMEFGTLCAECKKLQNLQVVAKLYDGDRSGNEAMRYVGSDKK